MAEPAHEQEKLWSSQSFSRSSVDRLLDGGSPMPDPTDNSPRFEVPAGVLDDDPKITPDKQIFVDFKSPWFSITDNLPQMDEKAIRRHRAQT